MAGAGSHRVESTPKLLIRSEHGGVFSGRVPVLFVPGRYSWIRHNSPSYCRRLAFARGVLTNMSFRARLFSRRQLDSKTPRLFE